MRRVANPPDPWGSTHVEYLAAPPAVELEVYEEEAKSILSENSSPDVPFRWSVNPYLAKRLASTSWTRLASSSCSKPITRSSA